MIQNPDAIFKLSKLYRSMGGQIERIGLRIPTGGDLLACGMPTVAELNSDTETVRIVTDGAALKRLLARISGEPDYLFDDLIAGDLMSLSAWVSKQCGPLAVEESIPGSTPPGSGGTSPTS